MILLFGSSDDVLVGAVSRLLNDRGSRSQNVTEPDLFSTVPFAFEQRGQEFSGTMWLNGRAICLNDVSGVLVRLPRTWSPPPEFDLQDQVFIYHESAAAWFALIAGLRCPMFNRPALSSWVQDLTYPETLAHRLAERLALSVVGQSPPAQEVGRLVPTGSPAFSHSTSFFAVDGELIPRLADDKALATRLARMALGEWQQENDLRFCRLDFERYDHTLKLAKVETYPLLDEEPAGVVEQVAAAITEALA